MMMTVRPSGASNGIESLSASNTCIQNLWDPADAKLATILSQPMSQVVACDLPFPARGQMRRGLG